MSGDSMPFLKSSARAVAPWSNFLKTRLQEYVRNAKLRLPMTVRILDAHCGVRHPHLIRGIFVQSSDDQKIGSTGGPNWIIQWMRSQLKNVN